MRWLLATARLVTCHGTNAEDVIIRRDGFSVFWKYPRVGRILPQRAATKRDKDYLEWHPLSLSPSLITSVVFSPCKIR